MMRQDVKFCVMQGLQHSFSSLLCMMCVGCPARSSLACGPLSAWAGPLPSACGFLSRAEQGGTSVPQVWPAGLP